MKKTFILTALFFSLFLIGCKDEDPTTNPNGRFDWTVTTLTYNRAFTYQGGKAKEVIDGKYPSQPTFSCNTYYVNKTSAEIDSIITPQQDTPVNLSTRVWYDDVEHATVYQYKRFTKEVTKK